MSDPLDDRTALKALTAGFALMTGASAEQANRPAREYLRRLWRRGYEAAQADRHDPLYRSPNPFSPGPKDAS